MESATGQSSLGNDVRNTVNMYHFQGQFLRLILPGVLTLLAHIVPFVSILLEESDSIFAVDCVWNVMAHARKPDLIFRRNGRVHLNRPGRGGGGAGSSVQSTTDSRAVHISLQGLYCSCKPVSCSHVTLTGYPLHSLVSPSLLLPCVTVCHHISTGL
jgi:hypothetical protein